jgi:DNA-binding CsgD family transcriptional regulator
MDTRALELAECARDGLGVRTAYVGCHYKETVAMLGCRVGGLSRTCDQELRTVHNFDLAQSFIECCERRDPTDQVAAFLQTLLERMGFVYFACCSHVDPSNPPPSVVMAHNYPSIWVHVFKEMEFYKDDPVLMRAERSAHPFFWNDRTFRSQLTKSQENVLSGAGELGIENGYTVPIHSPQILGAPLGSCSLVPDSDTIDEQGYATARLLAMHFYAAASRADYSPNDPIPITLSRWERDCLELVARGQSDWLAGEMLGISERSVFRHVENVMRRLGVATREQAIVQALMAGKISFGDVVRARPDDDQ